MSDVAMIISFAVKDLCPQYQASVNQQLQAEGYGSCCRNTEERFK
jgi:hypothetical protein